MSFFQTFANRNANKGKQNNKSCETSILVDPKKIKLKKKSDQNDVSLNEQI